MKRILCCLLALLLPALAAAESSVALLSETPLALGNDVQRIAGHVLLPDGQLIVNGHSKSGETWMEFLQSFDAQGNSLWSLPLYAYEENQYVKDRILAVKPDGVECLLFDQIAKGSYVHKGVTCVSFTGEVLEERDEGMVELTEKPEVYHCGDFLVERYFGDYSVEKTPVTITHLPTGNVRHWDGIPGTGNFHAFSDRLMYVQYGSDKGGRYWVFDEKGDMLVENQPAPFECTYPVIGFSAQDEEYLYLFVWNKQSGMSQRDYTIYPVDRQMNILPPLTSFTLGSVEPEEGMFLLDTDKSLSQPVVLGNGFLLLADHPWEWQKPLKRDLCYLDRDGTLTVLETIAQADTDQVLLLPGPEAGQCRLILRAEDGAGYVQRIYTAP